MPTPLRNLFEKPIDRHIEGVIKADDESDLLTEVSEYVVTKEIARRLDDLVSAYLAGGTSNGVWIAGFFGSGKSHLLKLLSLLLENRLLGTTRVADLFLPKLAEDDPLLKADLEKAIKIPSCSIRFNIDQKADLIAKDQLDALLAVFVKVFNELRGYGWPQMATLCLVARLFMRGKAEIRTGGNILTAEEALDALKADRTDTLHARSITTDTGWKITLDRGLDIYQRYEISPFNLAAGVQEERLTKAFEIAYLRL